MRTIFKENANKNSNSVSSVKILRQCAKFCQALFRCHSDRSCVLDEIFSNTIRDAAKEKGEEECSGKLTALRLLLQSLKNINEKNRSVNNGSYQRVVIVPDS